MKDSFLGRGLQRIAGCEHIVHTVGLVKVLSPHGDLKTRYLLVS